MDEGPVRNTPDGAFVCSAGQRSVVDLDTGAHRGPVIEPLGLVHWHVDAPVRARIAERRAPGGAVEAVAAMEVLHPRHIRVDRKSTRLNSSHVAISYAVFCLKKKKTSNKPTSRVTPMYQHKPEQYY